MKYGDEHVKRYCDAYFNVSVKQFIKAHLGSTAYYCGIIINHYLGVMQVAADLRISHGGKISFAFEK